MAKIEMKRLTMNCEQTTFLLLLFVFVLMAFLQSCKKEVVENPYALVDRTVHNENPEPDALPYGSFVWLHAKVFRPTCANSGCHDGTFEPEFRTIASSYNSLVNHPVIANDPQETFLYRVVPGNAGASFLHERLTTFVPNTSGVMPLEVDPGSEWESKSEFYIQKIKEWINNGAPDMYGNPAPPVNVNAPPLVYGLVVFPHNNTTTPYPREQNSIYGIGAIEVPPSLVDVWILPYDDNAGLNEFSSISLKVASEISGFSGVQPASFSLESPVTALDFGNSSNQFYYKATLDLGGIPSGEYRYLRTYLDDDVQQNITEVPNDASNYFWYLLFSLKIQ
ncbi:MAG: hypothetical protein IT223_01715 [Crocinitomicaceae bacterium]|nr:hypothetical protein [Crocinitomicaceae bacterium]